MWTKEDWIRLAQTKKFAVAAASALSLAGGAAAGYSVAAKKLQKAYDERLETEIEKTRRHYAIEYKRDEFSDPISAAAALNKMAPDGPDSPEYTPYSDVLKKLKYVSEEGDAPLEKDAIDEATEVLEDAVEEVEDILEGEDESLATPTVVRRNIFTEAAKQAEWDIEEEIRKRDTDKPYVISEDEFLQAEKDYEVTQLTYFSEDDVLVDAQERPIQNEVELVGDDFAERFGHGTKDTNLVHVRNDILELDFKITRLVGSYKTEVLGLEDNSLKHADRSGKGRKFRHDDE